MSPFYRELSQSHPELLRSVEFALRLITALLITIAAALVLLEAEISLGLPLSDHDALAMLQ